MQPKFFLLSLLLLSSASLINAGPDETGRFYPNGLSPKRLNQNTYNSKKRGCVKDKARRKGYEQPHDICYKKKASIYLIGRTKADQKQFLHEQIEAGMQIEE